MNRNIIAFPGENEKGYADNPPAQSGCKKVGQFNLGSALSFPNRPQSNVCCAGFFFLRS
ncbi:hypothetical protein CLOSTMETH_01995 [[Clostridium] methylpentosum DSM 5476]|uniref:Uncharacterized protein n=1 Tax=[Clostridium] methylpentosum DSM 5476 TaxID=537013 RepID=C0EDR7_9FIRM|nr:hypothetical protein CLOSTMETH_01995 [[Clostridium] methylpentosum DSM 5476]